MGEIYKKSQKFCPNLKILSEIIHFVLYIEKESSYTNSQVRIITTKFSNIKICQEHPPA
jgi:hypothetical protein